MWSVVKSEILGIRERNQLQYSSWETSVESYFTTLSISTPYGMDGGMINER
jgi:hypothetical protein